MIVILLLVVQDGIVRLYASYNISDVLLVIVSSAFFF